jgi:hypothetical protein
MFSTSVFCQATFYGFNFRSHDVFAMVKDGRDIRLDLIPDAFLLSRQVNKLHNSFSLVGMFESGQNYKLLFFKNISTLMLLGVKVIT